MHRSTRRYFKGGSLDTNQDLAQKLQEQQNEYSAKIKLQGLYPPVPRELLQKMNISGVPWYLAQHPNQYSANPNEVLSFRNRADFTDSSFYNNYESQLTLVPEMKGYGKTKRQVISGEPLRIVFASSSDDDNTQYYIDPSNEDEFIDILNDAKDSNILVPIEFLSKQFMDENKIKTQQRIFEDNQVWTAGYNQAVQTIQEQEREQSQDDNSAWGGLKKGFEMATEIAPLLI